MTTDLTKQPDAGADAETAAGETAISGAEIVLEDVVKQYPGQKVPAVKGLSLTIPAGEIVMFVGPSGCGKTTSLKMINRLIEPTSGTIRIDGQDVRGQSETELRRILSGALTRLLGPNSIGIVNATNGLRLTANGAFAEPEMRAMMLGSWAGSVVTGHRPTEVFHGDA